MKKIEEMSTMELGTMSEEEFHKMLNEAKLELGLPIVNPEYPVKKLAPHIKNDGMIYYVFGMYVETREEADMIADFISRLNTLDVSIEYIGLESYCILSPNKKEKNARVEGIEFYNREKFYDWKKDINDGSKYDTNESYQKRIDEYHEIIDPINELESKYSKMYCQAIDRLKRIKELNKIFWEEYVPISNFDIDMALKFMQKAYKGEIDNEAIEYIKENEIK